MSLHDERTRKGTTLISSSLLGYFGADNTASSFASFQPTIVKSLGYTDSGDAQVHTIPVYMVALVCAMTAAYLSDRLSHRYSFCMLGVVFSIIGWAVQIVQVEPAGVRYFALFLTLSGTYVLMPVLVVWLSNNMGGSFKRGVATAVQIGGGNTANFVSANVFIPSQSPRYPVAFSVGLGLQVMAGVACTVLMLGMRAENKRRDRRAAEKGSGEGWTAEEKMILGDDHPDFRYTL